jgi:hypothetical protein
MNGIGPFALSGPPDRWRVIGRNLRWSQRHKRASLIRIASELRTVLAPHVAFKLMRRLRTSNDIKRYGLIGVAPKTSNLKVKIAGIDGVANRRRRLRGAFVAKHSVIPRLAGELVGFLPRELGTFSRDFDPSAVEIFARLRGHAAIKAVGGSLGKLSIPRGRRRPATTACRGCGKRSADARACHAGVLAVCTYSLHICWIARQTCL